MTYIQRFLQITGHVGVDKAGSFLNIEIRHVPIDPNTMKPDLKKFEAAIDNNTCMVSFKVF
jgi:glutamate/tyrosine decarboxylase-like PLP-dependent enzyme